jgi:hypothetical protein
MMPAQCVPCEISSRVQPFASSGLVRSMPWRICASCGWVLSQPESMIATFTPWPFSCGGTWPRPISSCPQPIICCCGKRGSREESGCSSMTLGLPSVFSVGRWT